MPSAYTPRQYAVPAKAFGTNQAISWRTGRGPAEQVRVDAARLQHEFARRIRGRLRATSLTTRQYALECARDYDRQLSILNGTAVMRLEDIAQAERILGEVVSVHHA